MNTNNMINAVVSDPLFAGDNNPKIANVNVATAINPNWTPVPTKQLNNIGEKLGGRNTSP